MNSTSLFPYFPNSWFSVACSNELPPNGVMPLHYFDKNFVLFRTSDGIPHVLDAYCPHLGAHLGYGGKVERNAIRCPFHALLWDETGHCIGAPKMIEVLPKAQIRNWPVREVNGLIFMYYHLQRELTQWEIPELPEYTSKEWTPLRQIRHWKLRTNIHEYSENTYDLDHFSVVHDKAFSEFKSDALEVEGSFLTHKLSTKLTPSLLTWILGKDTKVCIKSTRYGPGFESFYFSAKGRFEVNGMFVWSITPIDKEYLDIRLFISIKKLFNKPVTSILSAFLGSDGIKTQEEDFPILENKIYCNPYILGQSDELIMEYRQWMRQFYSELQATTNGSPKDVRIEKKK